MIESFVHELPQAMSNDPSSTEGNADAANSLVTQTHSDQVLSLFKQLTASNQALLRRVEDIRELVNNVFEARICFPLHYMSVISVLNVISQR